MSLLGNIVSDVTKAVTDPGALVSDAAKAVLPKNMAAVGDILGGIADIESGHPLAGTQPPDRCAQGPAATGAGCPGEGRSHPGRHGWGRAVAAPNKANQSSAAEAASAPPTPESPKVNVQRSGKKWSSRSTTARTRPSSPRSPATNQWSRSISDKPPTAGGSSPAGGPQERPMPRPQHRPRQRARLLPLRRAQPPPRRSYCRRQEPCQHHAADSRRPRARPLPARPPHSRRGGTTSAPHRPPRRRSPPRSLSKGSGGKRSPRSTTASAQPSSFSDLATARLSGPTPTGLERRPWSLRVPAAQHRRPKPGRHRALRRPRRPPPRRRPTPRARRPPRRPSLRRRRARLRTPKPRPAARAQKERVSRQREQRLVQRGRALRRRPICRA